MVVGLLAVMSWPTGSPRAFASSSFAFMMAEEKAASANESKSPEKTVGQKTENPEDKKRKRAIAEYALYLVWGLAAVFALLLLMVILWGNRIRRETRTNPAKKTKHDPLWYLRKPNSHAPEKPDDPKSESDTD